MRKNLIETAAYLIVKINFTLFSFVAEDESESVKEDESRDSEHPRDSGCFESSENLESCREEANKEEQEEEKEEEEEEKEEEKEEEEEGKEEQEEEKEEGKEEQEEEKEGQEEDKEEHVEEKDEEEEEKEERHPQEVEQAPEMGAVQEQLKELTLDEGC